ncbi:efflux RND transporter periplasmic adaptor subunit [Phenylobacterium sp.]|uniref:efflux RND transporter periplasmic adaptor subunit n=1 Tax=Phenylobacterium sp. TaxID=1871053 RepID=UPI0025CDFDD9|nr:efflux RND transporter periplasmic adaptor subunit [Phenylobacterium sp.]
MALPQIAASAPPAVPLTAAQARNMGLRTATATAATEAALATLPGVTTPPLNGRVIVSAPFAGTVVQVDVLEGQAVKAGQRLAVVYSQDALRVSSALVAAQAEARTAEAAARRARTLANEGIIAGARAEEAEARAAQARAMASENSRLLAGAGGGTGKAGEYALRAPISGHISQLSLQPGGGVEAMAPAIVVDRDDRLWVEARLPAALIGQVKVGAGVEVGGVRGRVVAAGTAIDPRTRSAVLRAELPPGTGLAPGRAVQLTVMGSAPAGSVAVPRSSLTRLDGRDAVFVRASDGYRPQIVTVQGVSRTLAVVTGLAPGAVVASAGVSQLKAAAGR